MAPTFKYVPRSAEDLNKRENQKGSSYIGILKDEFRAFQVKKENWVRFLPPTWEGARHYGMDIWVHYEVGPNNATVLCSASMDNKPCFMCEVASAEEARGEETTAFATKRVLAWVVDRKDDKAEIPVAWAQPWTVDRDIAKLCRDRQTGELYYIDHPENGYNVAFDRSDPPNSKYTGLQLDRRPSPVDDKFLEYAIAHPIPDTLLRRSYAEVKALYLGDAGAEETKKDETPAVVEKPREMTIARPVLTPLCEKGITFKGEKWVCANPEGHIGECDYSRKPVENSEAKASSPAPLISSKAAELRARLGK